MPKPKLAQPLPSIRVLDSHNTKQKADGMTDGVCARTRDVQDAQRWKQINLGIQRHGDERVAVTPTRPTMSVLMSLDIVRTPQLVSSFFDHSLTHIRTTRTRTHSHDTSRATSTGIGEAAARVPRAMGEEGQAHRRGACAVAIRASVAAGQAH
jgi:hypothetical protein